METKKMKKILLFLSSSGENQKAAQLAIEMAVLMKAKLIVIGVVDKVLVSRMKRFTEKSSTELEIEIEEKGWKQLYYVEELSKQQGVITIIMQKNGIIDKQIVNEAHRIKVDFIVLGYPHQIPGQAKRLVQGQVEKIIENAPCSVLVVK